MTEERDLKVDAGVTLHPDPSLLTTQQLIREIAALKELIFTRLDAMDKAIALFQDNMTRVPTDVDKEVSRLKELHDQKFTSIQILREQQNQYNTLAISKAETTTLKQLEQLGVLLQATGASIEGKITDIKDRITMIEGRTLGITNAAATQATSTTSHQNTASIIIAVVAALISLAGLVIVMIKL